VNRKSVSPEENDKQRNTNGRKIRKKEEAPGEKEQILLTNREMYVYVWLVIWIINTEMCYISSPV
jgi:hypothetical protein